jgi:ferredoxin-NADP reductase/Na+-translocating ferredoxin:NAD+ oxidoreductase RnfD subunit
MKFIDNFLNKTTMYRLILYCLSFLVLVAFSLSALDKLSFKPTEFVISTLLLVAFCLLVNWIFAKVFEAPSNIESVYATALILTLIIDPITQPSQALFLFFVAGIAMSSKYILAIYKKHIFNPVAASVAIAGLVLGQSASWWVGNIYMAPFVIIAGILIARKVRRSDLVITFFIVSLALILSNAVISGKDLIKSLEFIFLYSFIPFLGFFMLTEPLTTPPTKILRIIYGIIVGVLCVPFVSILNYHFTPELALIIGNVFSYLVSPKKKLVLALKEKVKIADNTYDFIFEPNKKFNFKPGQYFEWTLGHERMDNRGMRRYFTIASSPTENDLIMGIKFYDKPSSYKESLIHLEKGDIIVASQLSGDFIMPKNKNKKLVFIAGGIGVTPFRSMIKYLVDKGEKRDIIIFYSNQNVQDIAYKQIFDQAEKLLGIKTVYSLTDTEFIPSDWNGEKGFIDKKMIEKYVPNFKERVFYISGPRSMTVAFQKMLAGAGIRKKNIKTDFFPGFA